MRCLKIVLFLMPICATFLLNAKAFSQGLELGVENVITLTASDMPKGSGRYKDFYIDVNQGDTLTFDIKGKGGVDVGTMIELYPTESYNTEYRTRMPAYHQEWTSAPLPACKLKVRIIAYRPYGALSVYVEKQNPANKAGEANTDLQKMTVEQLLDRHRELVTQLQKIASELARRK